MNPPRKHIYDALSDLIGGTALRQLKNIDVPNGNRIWAKLEFQNPTESAFDRVYPGLFALAESQGAIRPGVTPVIECSTGNAGASFAWVARELGYQSTVVIHADSPPARIEQIRRLGAQIILSPAGLYGAGYVELLNELLAADRSRHQTIGAAPLERLYAVTKIVPAARQFHAPIATEAIHQLAAQSGRTTFAAFVAAVGSGDLICGVAEGFHAAGRHPVVVGMESAEMPTVSTLRDGGVLSSDPLPVDDLMLGVTGTSLPPERLNIDFSMINDVRGVTIAAWKEASQLLAEREGLHVGRTSAGSFAAAMEICEGFSDSDVLTVFFDPSWKYGTAFTPANPALYDVEEEVG